MTDDHTPDVRPIEDFSALSDDQWRERLNPDAYQVLRNAATERPFTSEYTDLETEGVYHCRGCGTELFRSTEKFHSHCGWPSFFDPADSDAVTTRVDDSLGTRRTEVLCATCGGHLGHVFAGEGYDTPTDLRYCINGIALELREK
ncbi:MAG TPA: peptide-methionine (R)-S-oxide reductase MsrB [Candidatus Corynebacterium avicola]|uniref:peptide-methionine (R)-S-oxide reductase n=1 Tax=Candidatus Corynebacterium avicola TaxID=2838527 RepID=A0A9D1UKJ2_9CORY|nr:peptide-methionine (R)-S-oxide reductase MsrB [Candidatus Corynebacterium avicola]